MNEKLSLVVHATHEAGVKLGGIGAVLDGLLGSTAYNQSVERTVLVGPMFANDPVIFERLNNPRSGLTIRYSSLHGIFDGVPAPQRAALQQIEAIFEVALLYGVRTFGTPNQGAYHHEVLLVDVSNPNRQQIDSYKFHIWQNYGINSTRYDWSSEFNLYIAIAQPLFAALKAIGADRKMSSEQSLAANQKFIIAHEWLGMPVVFAAQMSEPEQWRTIFYAHETVTARLLVEMHGGHDTRFYNALKKAKEWNLNLDAVFGNQDDFFKHPIVKQATRCDNIFAVGDLVVDELRFFGGDFTQANIDLVYNGVVATPCTLPAKLESKRLLQKYCENLLGYVPDYVFTHVTRMVPSKALWRDMRVMTHLDRLLGEAGKSAVLFVLSSSNAAGRRSEWVHAWEAKYGWPVGHRGDNGDLIDLEATLFFGGIEPFNQQAKHSKALLINQFGWSQERCGRRMPAEMSFLDLRLGSDLEFGQSIYEPFGIAQVEPLSFGALCCVSSVCGCVGFADRAAGGLAHLPNMVVADYCTLPSGYWIGSPYDALGIDQGVRDWIETQNSASTAQTIFERLPKSSASMEALLACGQTTAQRMSWEVVVQEYLLPGLQRAVK